MSPNLIPDVRTPAEMHDGLTMMTSPKVDKGRPLHAILAIGLIILLVGATVLHYWVVMG
jgi:hypothetical protein